MFSHYAQPKKYVGYYMFRPKVKYDQERLVAAGKLDRMYKSSYEKRVTNWIFNPMRIQRFYHKDGTFEDRLIGDLHLYHGGYYDRIEEVVEDFIVTQKMMQSRYIKDLYPGCRMEGGKQTANAIRAYVWGQAVRYCNIEKFYDTSEKEIKKQLGVFKPTEEMINKSKKRRLKTPNEKTDEKPAKILEDVDFSKLDMS